jgi:hypothetical protein
VAASAFSVTHHGILERGEKVGGVSKDRAELRICDSFGRRDNVVRTCERTRVLRTETRNEAGKSVPEIPVSSDLRRPSTRAASIWLLRAASLSPIDGARASDDIWAAHAYASPIRTIGASRHCQIAHAVGAPCVKGHWKSSALEPL